MKNFYIYNIYVKSYNFYRIILPYLSVRDYINSLIFILDSTNLNLHHLKFIIAKSIAY